MPCVVETRGERIELGHGLVDEYVELVRARARRNTLLAVAYDLRVSFRVVDRDPVEVTTADVFGFVKAQRQGSSEVVRISDGASGLALSTIRRRLSSLSGFYAYLVATGRRETSPVLRGLPTQTSLRRRRRGVPLVRAVRQLPRVLEPGEVVALLGALRTWRDQAMVEAMVLGGCAALRCSGCGSRTCGPASGGCSLLTARAANSGWCPCPGGSSPAWLAT
jgi:site-specific recombinase XerD